MRTKVVKIEKEAQYHLLQMLIRQIHIGIISLEGDTLALINPTAEQLLNISGLQKLEADPPAEPGAYGPTRTTGHTRAQADRIQDQQHYARPSLM